MYDPAHLNLEFWRDRPVFLTGGTGFLGSWLVRRLLQAEANVVCLVRHWTPQSELVSRRLIDRVTVVRGDLCDQALIERTLAEFDIRTVIHLAAQSINAVAHRNPGLTFEANIGGTWKLLEACRRTPTVGQILVASSEKAYGGDVDSPRTEESPLLARSPFDVSKACTDIIAQSYAQTYNMPVVITRSGNLFGGGDLNWQRIVPGTIRSIFRKQRPVIRSNGARQRDFLYVEDSAAAHMYLAEELALREELAGEAFNLSGESQLTARELVQRILAATGSNLEADVLGESIPEATQNVLSTSKAEKLLGWRASIPFDEALRRTVEWYRSHFADPVLNQDIIPIAKAA